ncbi:hypothetical protein IDM40_11420 [Nocardiopsis sp. HNM0947]|uniref:DoxX family protein n=1 Tax=Nocardiopsis coralli TaxID=2772213 RepID=A0ABR9P670_9ACTN|nr:hypothetical protein [Nocardiopsis coralli]MBE2999311.1 hypothetical protein [Nocardiopsis coralli]
MSRPPRALPLVRALAPAAALACLALPFHALAGTHPSPAHMTGFEVLAAAPTGTPAPGPVAVAALVVCASALGLAGLWRPSVLVVLAGLLSTVSATALLVHHQSALKALSPGPDLAGYWLAVSLLVMAVLASLAELLYTDVGEDLGGSDDLRD